MEVIEWPAKGTPALRFTLDKFKQLEGSSRMRGYLLNVAVQNLSPRLIPAARFSLYFFDKNKVWVGEEFIAVNNLGPGETVKLRFTTRPPAYRCPYPSRTPLRQSVPQGAVLTLDQAELGTTPRIINVGGKHTVTFTKEGFTAGAYPRGAPVPNLPAPTTNP